MSTANGVESARKFYHVSMLLRVPISHFREQHPHDCIIADFLCPWVHDMANNLSIPRLAFNGFSLFTVAAMETLRSNPTLVSDADTLLIPHFPTASPCAPDHPRGSPPSWRGFWKQRRRATVSGYMGSIIIWK
ncbi:hypothetical protein V8G54_034934 [Vigna mungo]|uniref:Uncharacterized protein n=1 Tax=Vigna mungo TaxID=3915 RepID=A0AAQ3MED6_VIGMU